MNKQELIALKQNKNDLIDQLGSIDMEVSETRSLETIDEEIRQLEEQIETITTQIEEATAELENRSLEVPLSQEELDIRSEFMKMVDTEKGDIGSVELRAGEGYNVANYLGTDASSMANKGSDVSKSTPLNINDYILKAIDHNTNIYSRTNAIALDGTKRIVLDKEAPTKARLVKEGEEIATVDGEFRPVELKPYKFAEIVKFTRESVEDVNFDIVGHATQRLITSFAKALEYYIVAGTGVNEPQGLISADFSKTGLQDAKKHTLVTKDTLSLKDVVNCYYNLPHEMRQGSVFLCHPTTLMALALLLDGKGRPLLVPGINGERHTVMGKPVIESYDMPEIGQTTKPFAMFVNIQEAVSVGVAQNLEIRQLNELYAANDMVAIQGVLRFDSRVIKDGAISSIFNKA